MTFLSGLLGLLMIIATWRLFTKMGQHGWACLIPLYGEYVEFKAVYGNGWRFLLLLIPLYDIYVAIKLQIDLSHAFGKEGGFTAGMILLAPIFELILAFGDAQFRGGMYDIGSKDDLSRGVDNVAHRLTHDEHALEKLKDLDDLHQRGVINDAEYEAKKQELLKRV